MESDRLLQPWEAAQILGVDPKTLSRWAKLGKVPATRTLGGHRRYRESVIRDLLNNNN